MTILNKSHSKFNFPEGCVIQYSIMSLFSAVIQENSTNTYKHDGIWWWTSSLTVTTQDAWTLLIRHITRNGGFCPSYLSHGQRVKSDFPKVVWPQLPNKYVFVPSHQNFTINEDVLLIFSWIPKFISQEHCRNQGTVGISLTRMSRSYPQMDLEIGIPSKLLE